MAKLIISSREEALALKDAINPEITIIEFAKFPIGDEEIFALNSFVKNHAQSLEAIDLRGVLELQYRHLKDIAENANLHNASLKMVALNAANLHGATKQDHRLSEEKSVKEKFANYQQYLQKNYPDFSKQNRMNFSTNIPDEFLQLMDVFQRNIAMLQDQEWKTHLELSEAALEGDPTLAYEQQFKLFAEYKRQKAANLASKADLEEDFVEVDNSDFDNSDEEDFVNVEPHAAAALEIPSANSVTSAASSPLARKSGIIKKLGG
jgi:hypothetical protein